MPAVFPHPWYCLVEQSEERQRRMASRHLLWTARDWNKEISRCVLRRLADLLLEMTGCHYLINGVSVVLLCSRFGVTPPREYITCTAGGRKCISLLTNFYARRLITPVPCLLDRANGVREWRDLPMESKGSE